jgi:hypothetical protein
VTTVAHTLGLKKTDFPVSAQKGLVAKINKDAPLLAKTRLPALEYALSKELIPAKQDIIRANWNPIFTKSLLRNRPSFHRAAGMSWSRCWNSRVARQKYECDRTHDETCRCREKEFDASLIRMQGTRSVFTRLSTEVYTNLGMDILREEIRKTREAMEKAICRWACAINQTLFASAP